MPIWQDDDHSLGTLPPWKPTWKYTSLSLSIILFFNLLRLLRFSGPVAFLELFVYLTDCSQGLTNHNMTSICLASAS